MLNKVSMYSSALALDTSRSISAWDYATPTGDDDFNDSDNYETPGNLSYQRSPFFCYDECFCPCPEEPFVRRIVRWVKMIARSKHGMTVLFGVVPLLVGLLIGIHLGRRFERQQNVKEGKTDITPNRFKKWSKILAAAMHQFTLGFLWLRSLISCVVVYVLAVRWSPTANNQHQHSGPTSRPPQQADQERTENDKTRIKLLKNPSCYRQSGVDLELLPSHIAFIMDGNRRYGSAKYKSASRGHIDGGYKLQDVVHWCLEECIQEITVYAFSTENWNRSQAEIDALMSIFCQQCEELRRESVKLQIVVRVLSTETAPVSTHLISKLLLDLNLVYSHLRITSLSKLIFSMNTGFGDRYPIMSKRN